MHQILVWFRRNPLFTSHIHIHDVKGIDHLALLPHSADESMPLRRDCFPPASTSTPPFAPTLCPTLPGTRRWRVNRYGFFYTLHDAPPSNILVDTYDARLLGSSGISC